MKLKNVFRLIKDNGRYVGVITILVIIQALLAFVLPITVSKVIDGDLEIKKYLIIFLIIVVTLLINLLIIQIKRSAIIKYKQNINMEIFNELSMVVCQKYNEKGAAYYIERIGTAVYQFADFILTTIPSYIKTILTIILCLVLIGKDSLLLIGILGLLLVIQYYGYKVLNIQLSKKSKRLQDVCASRFADNISIFNNVEFIKQFGGSSKIQSILNQNVHDIHRETTDINTYAGNFCYVLNSIIANLQYVMYLVLAILLANNSIDMSMFLFDIMIIVICFEAFNDLVSLNVNMKDVNASFEFLTNDIENNLERMGGDEIDHIRNIEFKGTTIQYKKNILIQNINLTFNQGDIVFISGETGTGKSSFVKSLMGFVDADNIFFNGIEQKKILLSSLRKRVAYISQMNSIFNGTVKDNIELNVDANQEYERMSFFDKFVGKENLKLTSDGTNLSGGDKQKIVLGRLIANCKDVDVIILDEVTSSMDTDTETKAFDEILPLLKNKIVLIISHNKNLQRYANRIVKLKDKTIMLENN